MVPTFFLVFPYLSFVGKLQAVAAFMELVSTDPDFANGPACLITLGVLRISFELPDIFREIRTGRGSFWRSIYRLWPLAQKDWMAKKRSEDAQLMEKPAIQIYRM